MTVREDGVGTSGRIVAILISAGMLLLAAPPPAHAQVTLTTPFPAVDVEAASSVTLDLEVRSPVRQRVELEVVSAPEGWATTLRGGGFVVHGVTSDPDAPVRVDLTVEVPAEAAAGPQSVVVEARAADGTTDSTSIDLLVAEEVAGAITFESEFPELRGGSDDTFAFNLTLRNETPRDTTFALSTAAPEGWQVEARPAAEQQATTVSVEGGSTASVNVDVTPPPTATAGEYAVEVTATGAGNSVTSTLTVVIVGSFQLTLATASERLNAGGVSGEATSVALVVRNEGSAALTDVTLTASPPTDWEVSFEPAEVPEIAPGQEASVTASIVPSGQAVVGDYSLTLRAAANGRNDSVELRFAVQTSTTWGVVGVLLIIAAVGGLAWVFRRYGRR